MVAASARARTKGRVDVISNLFYGERVRLTAFRVEDAKTWAVWFQDGEFGRLLMSETRPRSEREMEKFITETVNAQDEYMLAIRLHYSDEIIGFVHLDDIRWNHRTAWVSIAIGDSSHRGKRYGEEAMRLTLKFAFHELNLHRLQLNVYSYNDRAIRLYERLGFQREGVQREALLRDGQHYDVYGYGLLASEWTG